MISGKHLLFSIVFLCVLGPYSPAYAYLDPGTGSMLVQMLLGGVAGVLVIGKLYWHRVKVLFSRGPAPSPSQDRDADIDGK